MISRNAMFKVFWPRNRRRFHIFFGNKKIKDWLKDVYREKLLPLEEHHLFHAFHSPKLNDIDFDVKPIILLMGQYSTGKTTLIKYLLQSDFPGMRIGPEPTTDKFMAVMYDEKSNIIPGNALVTDPTKPFGPLAKYGNTFLTRFQCSTSPSQILQSITLIDTPGILSGEKQRVDRGYDFTGVLHWFAERVDRIILLFDAHKLDISDEFKWAIETLKRNSDKILILLNKADMVDHQSLMRIYGSLMWSLQKVINTPEVPRVFIGSFWDKPFQNNINRKLFEDEECDLFKDIERLPSNSMLRKLNDLNRRARLAIVHAHIMDSLRRNASSSFFFTNKKKMAMISGLKELFLVLQTDLPISAGDFPDVKEMQEKLIHYNFSHFEKIKPNLLEAAYELLEVDIPKIISMMAGEEPAQQELKGIKEYVDLVHYVRTKRLSTEWNCNSGDGENNLVVDKSNSSQETKLHPSGNLTKEEVTQ